MSTNTRTSRPAKHALPRIAFFARVLLQVSVLFAAALLPCAAPGFGLLNVNESEAPVDQDESPEEEAISVLTRKGVDRDQSGWTLPAPVCRDLSLAMHRIACVPHSGHRLPNDLLAPPRC